MNTQIDIVDAINFILAEFGKKLPSVGSRVLALLYMGNDKKTAKVFNYRCIDVPSIMVNYLWKKVERTSDDIEASLSRFLFIVFALRGLMKEGLLEVQALFEMGLRTSEGTAQKAILRDLLKRMSPLKLYCKDMEYVLKVFSSPKDDTRILYKKFVDIMASVDLTKQKRYMIPVFSVCYAMVRGLAETSDEIPERLAPAINLQLGVDRLSRDAER